MELNYGYNRNEEIISLLQKNFQELSGFKIRIIFSDEIPPYIEQLYETDLLTPEVELIPNSDNKILSQYPICNLLGKYIYSTKEIIIYLQGINRVTEKESIRKNYQCSKYQFFQSLLKTVVLHEIGHYWFHNCLDAELLNIEGLCLTSKFDYVNIDEWVAQMFAYFCLDYKEDKHFMLEFAKKQPYEYTTFVDNKDLDIEKFKEYSRLLHLENVYRYVECKRGGSIIPNCIGNITNSSIENLRADKEKFYKSISEWAIIMKEAAKYGELGL